MRDWFNTQSYHKLKSFTLSREVEEWEVVGVFWSILPKTTRNQRGYRIRYSGRYIIKNIVNEEKSQISQF